VGYWSSLATSSDGTKLVAAVAVGNLYTSSDSGATWTIPQKGPVDNWQSVASSADGTKLVAVGMSQGQSLMAGGGFKYGYIYVSGDSGATWTQTGTQEEWTGVASSADGTKLVVVGGGGYIRTSGDSGATWTDRAQALDQLWNAVASSADGTKLVAAGSLIASPDPGGDFFAGYIYTSGDSGVTWTRRGTLQEWTQEWTSVASSADGTKLVAASGRINPGYIYVSGDSGATWTRTGTPQFWTSVASSADGTKLVAASGRINPGSIYVSTDSGATWTQTGAQQEWASVASSADGTKLIAAAYGGFIYTSY
jgi:photosystem II stability/assembly factor-like uncharacterized protein